MKSELKKKKKKKYFHEINYKSKNTTFRPLKVRYLGWFPRFYLSSLTSLPPQTFPEGNFYLYLEFVSKIR